MTAPKTKDEMIAKLHEVAEQALGRNQNGVALKAYSEIARLNGVFPARRPRPANKRLPRREPTLLEAADAIAKGVEAER